MHDGIEGGERVLVGHDPAPESCPIQRAVVADHPRTELFGDGSEYRRARGLNVPHELVGIDQGRPPAGKACPYRRLSGGGVSGEGDV